jgi:hypothetical protein
VIPDLVAQPAIAYQIRVSFFIGLDGAQWIVFFPDISYQSMTDNQL